MKKTLALALAAAMLLALVAGCSSGESEDAEEDSAATEEAVETEDAAETDEAEAEPSAEGTSDLSGVWENPDGSVFREITFSDDGTAQTVNYAGTQDSATWTLDGDYLKVETDGGESWGSSIEWISDTEFKWSYESDTWNKAD